jgi:hypothetical protein
MLLALASWSFAGLPIVPTTTLQTESGNNTSAASSFVAQTNGNAGAGNVSKLAVRSLLYAGATTRIYAHFMPWFGGANHMNVGYASDDPAQAKRQVDDMMSRGIGGAIIDWHGPNFTLENNASKVMMQEAETRGGQFEFAIMEDGGQFATCAATPGCDVTQQATSDLNYAFSTFESSPAYMRWGGRPVVFFFDGTSYAIDWNRLASNVSGNALFVFRNSVGFTHAQSSGGFSWVNPMANPSDIGTSYLDNFYSTAGSHSAQVAFGSPYKGFNDSLAAWGANRIMNQSCGQTWLATMAEIGKFYSASNQLAGLQLVTWNDYEEGTELESGIDNCVTIAASLTGSMLGWNITGAEATLDHYTVFISTDGQNLMPLTDAAAGVHALDLSGFALDPGSYTLYVKAIGRPTLTNHISGAVAYNIASSPPPPVVKLNVNPAQGIAPLNVTASTAGSSAPAGSIVATIIDFGDGTNTAVGAGGAASHVYASSGNYTVRATVKDNLGATSSASSPATVAAPGVTITITGGGHKAFILPVAIVVQGFSSKPITEIELSLDGKLMAQSPAGYLKMILHLRTRGIRHTLTATAKDSAGTNFSATATLPGP